jgi:predicted ATPase
MPTKFHDRVPLLARQYRVRRITSASEYDQYVAWLNELRQQNGQGDPNHKDLLALLILVIKASRKFPEERTTKTWRPHS